MYFLFIIMLPCSDHVVYLCVYIVGSKEEMHRKMTECLTEELDLPPQNPNTQPPVPPPSTSSPDPDAPLPLSSIDSELDPSQPSSSSFVAPPKTKKKKSVVNMHRVVCVNV